MKAYTHEDSEPAVNPKRNPYTTQPCKPTLGLVWRSRRDGAAERSPIFDWPVYDGKKMCTTGLYGG